MLPLLPYMLLGCWLLAVVAAACASALFLSVPFFVLLPLNTPLQQSPPFHFVPKSSNAVP
jgi:hypothetical protein